MSPEPSRDIPEEMISAYLDGTLEPEAEDYLREWLSADPSHVEEFLFQLEVHTALQERRHVESALSEADERGVPGPEAEAWNVPTATYRPVGRSTLYAVAMYGGLTLAATFLLATLWFFTDRPARSRRVHFAESPSVPAGATDDARRSRRTVHRFIGPPRRPARRIDRFEPLPGAPAVAPRAEDAEAAPLPADAVAEARPDEAAAHADEGGVEHIAYIDRTEGDVEVRPAGEDAWQEAFEGLAVFPGDSVRTKYARARVFYESKTVLCMNRFTTITCAGNGVPGVSMVGGEVYVEVSERDTGFRVETPQGSTVDLGTRFAVGVKRVTGTKVLVAEGSVEVGNTVGRAVVGEDQTVDLPSTRMAPGAVRPARDVDARLSWAYELSGDARQRLTRASFVRGMIAYWCFDEGVGSYAGNALGDHLRGRLLGASWVPGCLGPALGFDGADCVLCDGDRYLDMIRDEFTIAAWVLIDELGQNMKIGGRMTHGGGHVNIKGAKAPPGGYKFEVIDGKLSLEVRNASNKAYKSAGRRPVPVGTWVHVAAVYDGGVDIVRLYMNGAEDAAVRVPVEMSPTAGPFVIGRQPWGSGYHWRGRIDEMSLYTRALDPREIRMLSVWSGRRSRR